MFPFQKQIENEAVKKRFEYVGVDVILPRVAYMLIWYRTFIYNFVLLLKI